MDDEAGADRPDPDEPAEGGEELEDSDEDAEPLKCPVCLLVLANPVERFLHDCSDSSSAEGDVATEPEVTPRRLESDGTSGEDLNPLQCRNCRKILMDRVEHFLHDCDSDSEEPTRE